MGHATQAARRNASTLRERVNSQARRAGDDDILSVRALRHAHDGKPLGQRRGHVLGGMDAQIDFAVEQSALKLFRKQAFVADFRKSHVKDLVALRVNDANLAGQSRLGLLKQAFHEIGLVQGQLAAPASDDDLPHWFIAPRLASVLIFACGTSNK